MSDLQSSAKMIIYYVDKRTDNRRKTGNKGECS